MSVLSLLPWASPLLLSESFEPRLPRSLARSWPLSSYRIAIVCIDSLLRFRWGCQDEDGIFSEGGAGPVRDCGQVARLLVSCVIWAVGFIVVSGSKVGAASGV